MSAAERTPEQRETGIRRVAKAQRARFPTKGDWFTVDQVEFLISVIDELRAERDARMALFNTAAEIAGAAIADLEQENVTLRSRVTWLAQKGPNR